MDTQTSLIVVSITVFVLIIGLYLFFRRQDRRTIDRRVEATITQIQVEASSISNWWIVTAQWSDPKTGRILTFRSSRIKYHPHYRAGEHIRVSFDTNEPKRYRMEF